MSPHRWFPWFAPNKDTFPEHPTEIPIAVINRVNGARIEGKIVVQDGTAVASVKK